MSELTICETSVRVKKGDITAESTDAIVNITNSTLDQNTGVSKAILTAAGPTVKEECARLAKLHNDGCVVTSSGNLNCNYIVHLINAKPEMILTFVKKVLEVCDLYMMRSVSLPAIGTGAGNLDAQTSVKSMMLGIEEYLNNPTTQTSIDEINIVVFEQSIYDNYLNFFRNYKTACHHFSAYGTKIELIKGDITLQAVDCVLNLTNVTLNRSSGVSGAILTAAGKKVKKKCKGIGVLKQGKSVITKGGELKCEKIMHIIGPSTVLDFKSTIENILLECNQNGFASLALPAIGTGEVGIDPEDSITAILNSILNYLSKSPIPTLKIISIIVIEDNIYTKFLEVFQAKSKEIQQNSSGSGNPAVTPNLRSHLLNLMATGTDILQLQLKMKSLKFSAQQYKALQQKELSLSAGYDHVKIDFPLTWTDSEKSEFQEVILSENSTEFKTVKDNFLKTAMATKLDIIEITRIQNVKLWQSFTIKKQAAERRNPGAQNVRCLYHGTTSSAVNNINKGGFNRIYYGRNATACGTGTYFSVESNYATRDRYSTPDSSGNKYVYQASVITGKYCLGDSTYQEPPFINNDSNGDRYDSVVDYIKKPTYFVVFYDDCAYPEYLITLKLPTT